MLAELPERWWFFFAFLAEMGLRRGEAIELRWKDVEVGTAEVPALRPRLHVRRRFYRGRVARPNGGRTRRLTLTPQMADALRARRGDAGDEDLVFTSERGSRIGAETLMSRVLKPAAVRAGLGEMVESKRTRGGTLARSWVGWFHTFRHTCTTRLIVDDGWSLPQVQVHLGHQDLATTSRYYLHLVPDDLPDRSRVLDDEWVSRRRRARDAVRAV